MAPPEAVMLKVVPEPDVASRQNDAVPVTMLTAASRPLAAGARPPAGSSPRALWLWRPRGLALMRCLMATYHRARLNIHC